MSKTPESNGVPEELAIDEDAKGRSIIEAILTASDTPVTTGKLAELVGGETGAKEVRQYVDDLNEVYVQTGRAFRITEVAGGFQFSVHHEFAPWIRRLLQEKPARLSQAALEVLSIVAFKQPITKAEVEHIRGVASDGVIRHLMEKGLVRIAGRSEGVGRPLLYGTARDFLKFFGLKTLADLPKVREVEDLLKEDGEEAGEPEIEAGSAPRDAEVDAGCRKEGSCRCGSAGARAGCLQAGGSGEARAGEDKETDVTQDGVVSADGEVEQRLATKEDNGDSIGGEVSENGSASGTDEGEGVAGAAEQISGESGSRIEESV